MKKTLSLFLSLMILTLLNACSSLMTATLAPLATTGPTVYVETQTPIAVSTTEANLSAEWKTYRNATFRFSFLYPSNWFGPSEYISGETLRVEVGSDTVYPYGEPPQQPSDVKNSYNVVIQYTKNDQTSSWRDTFQSLLTLKDGESLASTRSLIIRVKHLQIGRFQGFEYITTLSETAQTDHIYIREAMLLDEQTNDLVTIMGQPYNVEVNTGTEWQKVYRTIDEANLTYFHKIVESITSN